MWCWKGLDQRADPVKKGRFASGFTETLYFGWLTHFSNHLVSYLPQNGLIDSPITDTTAGQKTPQALFSSLTIDHVEFRPLTIGQITLFASLWVALSFWPLTNCDHSCDNRMTSLCLSLLYLDWLNRVVPCDDSEGTVTRILVLKILVPWTEIFSGKMVPQDPFFW